MVLLVILIVNNSGRLVLVIFVIFTDIRASEQHVHKKLRMCSYDP
jgi:hypothetical protein